MEARAWKRLHTSNYFKRVSFNYFFSNANALRITAANTQKSYYMILIKLVLLINLASIRLILKCKYNVHKR